MSGAANGARPATDTTSEAEWVVGPGFEAVAAQFTRNLDEGDTGAAFAAYVDGRLVLDMWGGVAGAEWMRRRWAHDTLACIFSGTKGLVATCLLLLVERARLDLDRPVVDYWPEFGSAGKGNVLVRHLVSHLAGLPGLTTPVSLDDATDHVRMARLLAQQPTICPPGTRMFYHALTFGWLAGELIRRVDGRSTGAFFREEVAEVLELDAWIGLPEKHEPRVAVLNSGTGFGSQPRDVDASTLLDPVAWSIWANPPRFSGPSLPANARSWRAAEIPATNGVATAPALARLYGCLANGGEIDGARLMSAPTIELGTRRLSAGVDPFLRKPMAFGVGFALQTDDRTFGPAAAAFGHPGAGGSIHGAWPTLRTGFSYVTADLRESEGTDPRTDALMAVLYESVAGNGALRRSST